MHTIAFDVALMAPVPLEHLEDGFGVCARSGKVAYGSRAWEVFHRLDNLRDGLKVRACVYASHSDRPVGQRVTWQALYIGYVDCGKVDAAYEHRYRRPSTGRYPDDNRLHWPIF